MVDPFKIAGPALLSGGRTSGMMLRRILDAHGGTLPDDVIPTFANTGREMPETLDFVQEMATRWAVRIRWLEWRDGDGGGAFEEVSHNSASRNGEPFEALIRRRKFLPNPSARFCTEQLKISTMRRFAKSLGWDSDYRQTVGLRADEKHRVARLKHRNETGKDGQWCIFPLYDAGITKADVVAFWTVQDFDLRLPNVNGKTPLGNCDLCFLKGERTRAGIVRLYRERADWWLDMERATSATWSRPARGNIKAEVTLAQIVAAVDGEQPELMLTEQEQGDCFCHD